MRKLQTALSFLGQFILQPRKTIRQIIDLNPSYLFSSLARLYGVMQLLSFAPSFAKFFPTLSHWWPLFLLVILLAAQLFGTVMIYFWSFPLWLVGKWMKGKGRWKEVKAALAWAFLPSNFIFTLFLLLLICIYRGSYFASSFWVQSAPFSLHWAAAIISMATMIWSLVLLVVTLAEVHRMTIWKSVICIVSGLLFYLFLIAIPIALSS